MRERPHVKVLGRRNCPLCDDAKIVVAHASASGWCSWEEVDVDTMPDLAARFGHDVPVVMVGDEVKMMHFVELDDLAKALGRDPGRAPTC